MKSVARAETLEIFTLLLIYFSVISQIGNLIYERNEFNAESRILRARNSATLRNEKLKILVRVCVCVCVRRREYCFGNAN